MNKVVCISALLIFSFVPQSLVAANEAVSQDEAAKCRKITIDAERLKCYDFAMEEKKPPKESKQGKWISDITESKLDKSKQVVISLEASDSRIHKASFHNEKAMLMIRCKEKQTEFFIAWGYFVAPVGMGGMNVDFRVGNNAPEKATWQSSQNGHAYGTWTDKSTIPLIKRLIEAEDFYVRGDANITGTTEAHFSLEGIKEAILPIRENCKW